MLKQGMPPVHPGIILKEMYLEPLGVSISQLGDILGVARRTISLIINSHSGVSVEMALRFSKAFNTTSELWLNMQRDCDLWYAERKIGLNQIRNIKPIKKVIARSA
jgi:addiction module HigA family antidote